MNYGMNVEWSQDLANHKLMTHVMGDNHNQVYDDVENYFFWTY